VKTLLFDPQTAGGLLISLAADDAEELVWALEALGLPAAHMGDVETTRKPIIQVL
jgi:selenide,water dikinase